LKSICWKIFFVASSCTQRQFNGEAQRESQQTWKTVVKCNGLRFEINGGGCRSLESDMQIVINDVDNSFANLASRQVSQLSLP
jgi:hypothetical protein